MILLIPFEVGIACLFLHLSLRFTFGPLGQKGVALCALAVSLTSVALGESTASRLFLFLTSGGFASVYFHLFNMALTARRVELLVRALNKEEGRPSPPYSTTQLFSRRIERLEALGVLEAGPGGTVVLKPGLLLLGALAFGGLRRLFYPPKAAR